MMDVIVTSCSFCLLIKVYRHKGVIIPAAVIALFIPESYFL